MSLFDVAVEEADLSPDFLRVAGSPGFAPARAMLDEIYGQMGNRDGNLKTQFQTTGFDARIWELALFAAFKEQQWAIDQTQPAPDFILSDERLTWAVEATTAQRRGGSLGASTPEELLDFLSQELPIRLGSPLFSKLQRRYHELPNMEGVPLVLALECFITDEGNFFSENTVTDYLFGCRAVASRRDDGSLAVTFHRIDEHRVGEKVLPSGFFRFEETADIAAVLFSNSGTISKFNRMGYQRGLGDAIRMMVRFGALADHDPKADEPQLFKYDVGEGRESWSHGLVMIHNPNARNPLPRALLPGIAHYRLEDGKVASYLPEFHVFASRTVTLAVKDH